MGGCGRGKLREILKVTVEGMSEKIKWSALERGQVICAKGV